MLSSARPCPESRGCLPGSAADTTDEYPNWRVPLTGPDGQPMLLEDIFTDRRAATLAEAVRAATTSPMSCW